MAHADGYAAEHRLVLFEAGIAIPDGHQVHHINGDKADNRLENLAVVAIGDHTRIHWETERTSHCPRNHEFTPENTGRTREGWRYCKMCNRERARRHYHAAKRSAAAVSAGSAEHDRHQHGLQRLPELTQGLEMRFRPGQLSPAHERLMDVLGVRVVYDPCAPER